MNVLIVEDEELAAERLEGLLQQYDPSIIVLDKLDTAKDAAAFMQSEQDNLDLVFLDIQLADGTSFEIFDKIRYHKPVIFTTAYDQYSLKAFKVNSIDYLLKPVKYEELQGALNKLQTIRESGSEMPKLDYEAIKQLVGGQQRYKRRFIVKFGNRIQYKPVEDIAFIEADGKIVYISSRSQNRKFIIDHTLEELDSYLLDPEEFFRINRKFILKIDAINDVKSYTNSRLEIKINVPCEQTLIVSREKVRAFKEWLNR